MNVLTCNLQHRCFLGFGPLSSSSTLGQSFTPIKKNYEGLGVQVVGLKKGGLTSARITYYYCYYYPRIPTPIPVAQVFAVATSTLPPLSS